MKRAREEVVCCGGEEVMSIMKEMVELLQGITKMREQEKLVVVEMAATGVVG